MTRDHHEAEKERKSTLAADGASEDPSSEENSLHGKQEYLGFWKALLVMIAMYLSAFLVAMVRQDFILVRRDADWEQIGQNNSSYSCTEDHSSIQLAR